MNIRQIIEEKLSYHQAEVKKYQQALDLLEKNPEALDLISGILGESNLASRGGVTVRQAVKDALEHAKGGMQAADIRSDAKSRHSLEINPNTLSTVLTKMRAAGELTNDGRTWRLAKKAAA